MREKLQLIDRLINSKESRASYMRAKLGVNIASQIRALRRRHSNMTQEALALEAGMKQPRISAMERPGATKFNLETLIRLASAFKVGLIVKFASFGEMLAWENQFSQDLFDVVVIGNDIEFLRPEQESPAATPEIAWMRSFIRTGGQRTENKGLFGTTTGASGKEEKQQRVGHPALLGPQLEGGYINETLGSHAS